MNNNNIDYHAINNMLYAFEKIWDFQELLDKAFPPLIEKQILEASKDWDGSFSI